MTEQSAILYLEQRAKRLGWKHYEWTFQELVLSASQKKVLDGQDYLYLIIDGDADVTVESDNGYFGKNNQAVDELIEEHTGLIYLVNRAPFVRYARFLRGIPLNPP